MRLDFSGGRSHWTKEVLLIESWISVGGRNCYFRDHWSLSPDGQILTMEHRDDDLAGQMTVLEKMRRDEGNL